MGRLWRGVRKVRVSVVPGGAIVRAASRSGGNVCVRGYLVQVPRTGGALPVQWFVDHAAVQAAGEWPANLGRPYKAWRSVTDYLVSMAAVVGRPWNGGA